MCEILQECRGFTWRVPDCDELVGVLLTGDDGTDLARITGVCSAFFLRSMPWLFLLTINN